VDLVPGDEATVLRDQILDRQRRAVNVVDEEADVGGANETAFARRLHDHRRFQLRGRIRGRCRSRGGRWGGRSVRSSV